MSFTVDLREYLVSRPEVKALVTAGLIASDSDMPEGYIFEGKPLKKVERLSHKAIVVITSHETTRPPAPGSGWDFPKIYIDIWASPSRLSDGQVETPDADDLIRDIYKVLRPLIHITNRSPNNDDYFNWDGTIIATSEIVDGPRLFDVSNGNGARMGRIEIEISI
jgi:hypothetical protein